MKIHKAFKLIFPYNQAKAQQGLSSSDEAGPSLKHFVNFTFVFHI